MSLISFHRFLIAVAILFCGGYAARELTAAVRNGGAGAFVSGVVFAVLALGLLVYLIRLRSFLGYDGGEPSSP